MTPSNVKRTFRVYGTGNHLLNNVDAQYVGTVLDGSKFVWHLFEHLNI